MLQETGTKMVYQCRGLPVELLRKLGFVNHKRGYVKNLENKRRLHATVLKNRISIHLDEPNPRNPYFHRARLMVREVREAINKISQLD